MSNIEKTAEKADAVKNTETTREPEEMSAEELAKIAGGDIYIEFPPGNNKNR